MPDARMQSRQASVIIIGGGLSGLCLAQALVRNGFDATVFERDSGPDVRGQGYRLTIDAIGSGALRSCLPSMLYQFIRDTAGKATKKGAFIFLDEKARELHRFVFDTHEGDSQGHITGQVDRRTLRQALLSGLGTRVRFGRAFARYEESRDGVIAHFEDGSSAEGGLLVGADGVNSRVRRQRLPQAAARDTGILAIFGRARITGLDSSILGDFLSEGGIMALGPKGSLFFCTTMIFREPPAKVAARLDIDFATYPADDYAMWAVAVRKRVARIPESGSGTSSELDGARPKEIALGEIKEFSQDYKLLVEKTDADQTIPVPIRAMPRLKPWRPNRVTLMGDAIHAMPPYGAHGANTALRDAQTLAEGLAAGNLGYIEKTIGSYESVMRDYSYPAVQGALRMMKFATAAFPLKRTIFRTFAKIGTAFSRK
jgi:2-polyprenyl-6-methoxyphenol hydroxylase-like FAD-dependent oxidoreductase